LGGAIHRGRSGGAKKVGSKAREEKLLISKGGVEIRGESHDKKKKGEGPRKTEKGRGDLHISRRKKKKPPRQEEEKSLNRIQKVFLWRAGFLMADIAFKKKERKERG